MLPFKNMRAHARAQGYTVAVLNLFEVLGILEDPGELWGTYISENVKDADECIEEHPKSRSGDASRKTL